MASARQVVPPPPPGFELVDEQGIPPPPPGFELVRQETPFQAGARDLLSGVNRAYAGIGDIGVSGINALINWSNEAARAHPPRDGVARPDIPTIGSTSDALRSVGVDLDRPRGFMGMLGEYGAFGPAAAEKTAAGLGREALTTLAATAGGRAASLAFPDSPTAEVLGALSPFGLAPALSGLTRWGFRGSDPTKMQTRLADMDAAGVKPTVGSASGSKRAQAIENATAVLPAGHGVVKAAGTEANAALEANIRQLAGGGNRDTVIAGNTIKNGLFGDNGWIGRFRTTRNGLYSKLDAKLGTGTPVPASNTYQYLTVANKGVPGAPALSARQFIDGDLQNIADDFMADVHQSSTGGLPYDAIKKLRTRVGDKLDDPELIGSETRKMYSELYGALTQDMEDAARRAGATKEFEAANRYNKLGRQRVDDFFEGINKKVTPEEVYSLAVGKQPESATKLFKLKNSLTPDEWSVVRETVLNRMGRAQASKATEEFTFSAETFLTNYNNMKNNPRVLDALFGSSKSSYRQNLDLIARNASYLRESSQVLANPSGTAGLGLQGSALFGALGGAGNMALGALTGATAGAALPGVVTGVAAGTGGAYMLGKLLTNEAFVRWLAKSTALPVKQLPGHLARLAVISQTNPEFQGEIEEYKKRVEAIWNLQTAGATLR